jgi:IS30 family transposase
MSYPQLTSEERYAIARMRQRHNNQAEIARVPGPAPKHHQS